MPRARRRRRCSHRHSRQADRKSGVSGAAIMRTRKYTVNAYQRSAATTSQEDIGRLWTNSQCLVVSDIEPVLMQDVGKVDPAGPHGPNGAIGVTSAEIKAHARWRFARSNLSGNSSCERERCELCSKRRG